MCIILLSQLRSQVRHTTALTGWYVVNVKCANASKLMTNRTSMIWSAGTQSELQALATNPQTRFSSLFDEAKLTSDGKCPEGYLPANPPSAQFVKTVNGKKLHVQCLKIKVSDFSPGADVQAVVWCSYAGSRGCTGTCLYCAVPAGWQHSILVASMPKCCCNDTSCGKVVSGQHQSVQRACTRCNCKQKVG